MRKSLKYPSLWAVDGIRYIVTTAMPNGAGVYFLPTLKRTATLNVDLFRSMRDAERAATANLKAMAEAEGLSPAAMANRIMAEVDPAWHGAR